MESINQAEKVDSGAVYNDRDMILCNHPACYKMFTLKGHKKYCSPECKNDHHRMERVAGQKLLARGTIHAALLENSPRLQRAARYLSDGKPHSTRDIIIGADVCAVSTVVGELKDPKNGFDIECERRGEYWYYTMIGGETQLLRLV